MIFFSRKIGKKEEKRWKCRTCVTKRWGGRSCFFSSMIMVSFMLLCLFLLWINLRYCPLGSYWTKFSGCTGWHISNKSFFFSPRWEILIIWDSDLSQELIAWLPCSTQNGKPSLLASHVNYKPSGAVMVLGQSRPVSIPAPRESFIHKFNLTYL